MKIITVLEVAVDIHKQTFFFFVNCCSIIYIESVLLFKLICHFFCPIYPNEHVRIVNRARGLKAE